MGAQLVIAINSNYNGIRKFTIPGNNIRVDAVLSKLNALEPGWGGPTTGTIVGSPKEGSKLSFEEVIRMSKKLFNSFHFCKLTSNQILMKFMSVEIICKIFVVECVLIQIDNGCIT